MLRFLSLLCVLAVFSIASPAQAEKRIALVIGNSDYENAAELKNPTNDAGDVVAPLKRLGFEVLEGRNLDKRAMERLIRQFGVKLAGADLAFFFYAGHGLQVGGQNYLVPTDARLASEGDVDFEGLPLALILKQMEREAKTSIVLLDACRDNPMARNLARSMGTRSAAIGQGLAEVRTGVGTLIGFSTQPGNVAVDGAARNSPYAEALLKYMETPGMDVSGVLIAVRNYVLRATDGKQVPWEHTSLTGQVHLMGGAQPPEAPAPASPSAAGSTTPRGLPYEMNMELALWDRVKDSKDPAELQAYIDRFPQGAFVSLARVLIQRARREEAQRIAALREELLEEERKKVRAAELVERDRAEKQMLTTKQAVATPMREQEKAQAARPEVPPSSPAGDPQSSPKVAAVAPPRFMGQDARAFQDCPDCPLLVRVPAGSFMMGQAKGDPSAAPQHAVTVRAFAISQYPITVGEWKACVTGGGCSFTPRMVDPDDRTPVHNVSWDDTFQFIRWLSRSTGETYRLPTEAEWEYAARANTSTRYWWGDNVGAMLANCTDCGGNQGTRAPLFVGSFKPNPFGIHDVHGGVAQWVADCWFPNHQSAPADAGVRDQRNCQKRVLRGGSFRNDQEAITASARGNYDASVRYIAHGFRVARNLN